MYPFVPAYAKYGRRTGPVRAFVIHMAEGGGTVGYLSRPNPRGVSVHYVIEYSGRTVQMVAEANATGSINPNDLRAGDDPDGFYGISVARATMGSWYRDPNAAAITLEIEGFAKDGPNGRQLIALGELVDDVRVRFPTMGLLGHRDFTSRKACPGKEIPWAALGGHGPYSEDIMRTFTFTDQALTGTATVNGGGHSYLRLLDNTLHPIPDGTIKPAFGPVKLVGGGIGGPGDPRDTGYVIGAEAAFMITADVSFASVVDCDDAVDLALKAAADRVLHP